MHLHPPQGGENFFRPNLQEKCEIAPQPEQESIFRTVFTWCLKFGGIFRWSLRGRRLKKVVNFFGKKSVKKCTPDKILATPMYLAEPSPTFVNDTKLENVAIAMHCNLKPPDTATVISGFNYGAHTEVHSIVYSS